MLQIVCFNMLRLMGLGYCHLEDLDLDLVALLDQVGLVVHRALADRLGHLDLEDRLEAAVQAVLVEVAALADRLAAVVLLGQVGLLDHLEVVALLEPVELPVE